MRSPGSGVEKKDQALMVRLHSIDNHPLAEKTVESLTVDDLNIVTGMVVLFAKLDKVFLAEKVDEMYLKFFAHTKVKKDTMFQYIIDFEHLYDKMIENFISELPAELKGSLLLKNGDLAEANRNLILATVSDLKYDTVKSALKRVFNKQNSGKDSRDDKYPTEKEDEEDEAYYINRCPPFRSRPVQYSDLRTVATTSNAQKDTWKRK